MDKTGAYAREDYLPEAQGMLSKYDREQRQVDADYRRAKVERDAREAREAEGKR